MKEKKPHSLNHGPFAESLARAHGFGSNLLIMSMISDAILKMDQATEELKSATESGDPLVIEQKKLEVEAWKSSLKLTCLLLESEDHEEIIT
tara:strand:+ start:110 stop:385 length:276 start_codon:yes stop_codon:yes gene_type:complete